MLISIVFNINYGNSLRRDSLASLIITNIMESCILLINIIYFCICIITGSLRTYCSNRCSNISFKSYRFFKVISISINVLFPDKYSVSGSFNRYPACINSCFITNSFFKLERSGSYSRILSMSICMFLCVIPATKSITKADHLCIFTWFLSHIIRFNEYGSIIGTAFSVFIKYKPMSFSFIYRKDNITTNLDFFTIFIKCTFSIICQSVISINVVPTILDIPSLKVMIIIAFSVMHENCILLIIRSIICTEFYLT